MLLSCQGSMPHDYLRVKTPSKALMLTIPWYLGFSRIALGPRIRNDITFSTDVKEEAVRLVSIIQILPHVSGAPPSGVGAGSTLPLVIGPL